MTVVLHRYCVKSVQIRSLSWSVFSRIRTEYLSVFSPNAWKYGPGKILYLDTFHAVGVFYPIWGDDSIMPQWVELRLWFMVACEFCMLNKQILHIISLYGLNTTFNSIYTPYMGKSWPSKILYLWLLHAVLTTVLVVRIVLFSFRFLSVLFCCFLFIV